MTITKKRFRKHNIKKHNKRKTRSVLKDKYSRRKKNINKKKSKKYNKNYTRKKNRKLNGGNLSIDNDTIFVKKNKDSLKYPDLSVNVTRINTNHISNYDIDNCNINTDNDLSLYFRELKEELGSIYNYKYTIYPYCNEKIKVFNVGPLKTPKKLSEIFDKVNAPKIEKKVLEYFNAFKASFDDELYLGKGLSKTDNHLISSDSNANKFLDLLIKEDVTPQFNGSLIISHSSFLTELMKELYNYVSKEKDAKLIQREKVYDVDSNIGDNFNGFSEYGFSEYGLPLQFGGTKVVFDNLDILQIIINRKTGDLTKAIVRRFSNNYEINTEEPILNPLTYKVYFIMRHCVGCHNHPNATLKDKSMIKGYGEYAMCFKYTVNELQEKSRGLLNLLNAYGGIDKFHFGSSVIFRAILTSILVYNILKKENELLNMENEEELISSIKNITSRTKNIG